MLNKKNWKDFIPNESLSAAVLDPNLVGPTLPPIPPFTLPTGPTGPVTVATNARFVNGGSQLVNADEAIPLLTNDLLNGTDINHVLGSGDVTLQPGVYYASYQTAAIIPTPPGNAAIALFLNNVRITGTNVEFDNITDRGHHTCPST